MALISMAKSLDTGSAAGRLVITIMAAVSQWEREAIGERTRDALRHKRGKGEWVGNIECGYRLSADGIHVETDPAEQAALAAIRRLRSGGHSLRTIAGVLNGGSNGGTSNQPGRGEGAAAGGVISGTNLRRTARTSPGASKIGVCA